MVENCRKMGITPLNEEEFDRESQLMYLAAVKRRNGIPDERRPIGWPEANLGSY